MIRTIGGMILRRIGLKLMRLSKEEDVYAHSGLEEVRRDIRRMAVHPDYRDLYFHHEVGAWGAVPAILFVLAKIQAPTNGIRRHLDVGCGFGTLLALGRTLGYETTAADFVPVDKHLGPDIINNYKINYAHVNIESSDLPFEDGSFDVITMTEVLEHFNFSPRVPLSRICRVLAPGGILIVTTPALGSTQEPEIYDCPFEEIPAYESHPHQFLDRHMKIYGKDELFRLLRESGLNAFVSKYVDLTTGIEHFLAVATKGS